MFFKNKCEIYLRDLKFKLSSLESQQLKCDKRSHIYDELKNKLNEYQNIS